MVKPGFAITKLDAICRYEARRLTESASRDILVCDDRPLNGGRGMIDLKLVPVELGFRQPLILATEPHRHRHVIAPPTNTVARLHSDAFSDLVNQTTPTRTQRNANR